MAVIMAAMEKAEAGLRRLAMGRRAGDRDPRPARLRDLL